MFWLGSVNRTAGLPFFAQIRFRLKHRRWGKLRRSTPSRSGRAATRSLSVFSAAASVGCQGGAGEQGSSSVPPLVSLSLRLNKLSPIYPPFPPSVRPSIHPSLHPSIYASIPPSIHAWSWDQSRTESVHTAALDAHTHHCIAVNKEVWSD